MKAVFEVDIATEREAFEREGKKIGGIVEAFHGSSHANILSILKGGLVVPPSSDPHVLWTFMGGRGVYKHGIDKITRIFIWVLGRFAE